MRLVLFCASRHNAYREEKKEKAHLVWNMLSDMELGSISLCFLYDGLRWMFILRIITRFRLSRTCLRDAQLQLLVFHALLQRTDVGANIQKSTLDFFQIPYR